MGNRRRHSKEEAYESSGGCTNNDDSPPQPRKPIKMSVVEAKQKLFDVNLGFNVKLRTPFQEPDQTMAEDVFVMVEIALERGKIDPKRTRLAHAVAKHSVVSLRSHFGAESQDDAKLHLKLYVVDCYSGDREARIMSPGSGIGATRLCLVWILCLPDESIVLDGGRVGMTDDHWMGIWDLLYIKSGEKTLVNELVPKICEGIKQRIDIKSSQPGGWIW
jgi:hypothetical protein